MSDPIISEEERDIIRDDKGRWIPGGAPPACRPKGALGGRALALKTLDVMLGKERNQENLMNALQAHFDADPVRFFKQIVMPLLPTEVKMRLSEERGAQLVRPLPSSGGDDGAYRHHGSGGDV